VSESAAKPIQDADGLLNQWAKDSAGRICHASLCVVGIAYICPLPGCGKEIRVRAANSERYRAHLYHSELCTATGESHEHNLAKNIVAQRLREWLSGEKPAPFIGRMCEVHRTVFDVFGPLAGATGVELEGAAGERRADVMLLRDEAPMLAIEILFSHAVDEAKEHDLAALCVPWIEIDACQVINVPDRWVYVRGSADRHPCPLCESDKAIAASYTKVRAAEVEATKAAVETAKVARERLELTAVLSFERERARIAGQNANLAVKKALDDAAVATLRAARTEEDAQQRIDAAKRRVFEELPYVCSLCGIAIPADCDETSHPVDLGALYPHERDRYRTAHPRSRS
jgi:hypothetical protein